MKLIDDTATAWFEADVTKAENQIRVFREMLHDTKKTLFPFVGGNMEPIYANCIKIVEYYTDIAESAINIAMEKK